ncbi:hypothetical protein HDU98_002278 [Podochytrium sp. JEL0797]|nr:hypothetical protein HDU98_002278 [Podochytrium sp. JEL0797]
MDTDSLHFPSFDSLPFHDTPDNVYQAADAEANTVPLRHWCFLAEIVDISFVDRPRLTIDIGNGETAVIESSSRAPPSTFAWTDLRKGFTIAILYAQRRLVSCGSMGIRADNLGHVLIFRSGMNNLTAYARKVAQKSARECFLPGCGRKSMLIVSAQAKGAAVYCSDAHQFEAMVRAQQRMLFAQTQDLEWLLQVVKGNFYRSYEFLGCV